MSNGKARGKSMNLNEFSDSLAAKGVNVQPIVERATTGEISGVQALSELMSIAVESIPDKPKRNMIADRLNMLSWNHVVARFNKFTLYGIKLELKSMWCKTDVGLAQLIYEEINQS